MSTDGWSRTSSPKFWYRDLYSEEDSTEGGQDHREGEIEHKASAHHGALENLTGSVDDCIWRRRNGEHESAGSCDGERKDQL